MFLIKAFFRLLITTNMVFGLNLVTTVVLWFTAKEKLGATLLICSG